MSFQPFIRSLYALPPGRTHACATADIEAAEDRLGITLPALLRRYYQTLGSHEGINQSHNTLLLPAQLYITDDGHLAFYEENQGVVLWGIRLSDLDNDNPPVWGRYHHEPASADWHLEADDLSTFLQIMAVYNGTLGGLKYHACCLEALRPAALAHIEQHWPLLPQLSRGQQKIYSRAQQDVIALSFDDEGRSTGAFIGSQDQDYFDEMLEILDIDWSYVSYEDEEEEDDETE
ncbi:hypothetical protein L1281_001262 [Neisseria sp. HSC-16F19]|nr:SMI1/KNR4 family protein [Neisseria sp. HSC-16F19]MCP2040673.1 hypothetical protein [Neisseria sp. HSC-16F19]